MAAKLELTVSQLNEYVRRMFQMDPMLRAIELKGEISNLKFHQSGALFFTMKDENAAISCVMYGEFANAFASAGKIPAPNSTLPLSRSAFVCAAASAACSAGERIIPRC